VSVFLLAVCALVVYLVLLAARLQRGVEVPVAGLGALAAGMHLAALVADGLHEGHLPLDSMRWGLMALSLWGVLGWSIVRRRAQTSAVADLLLALAVLLLGAAQVAPAAGGRGGVGTLWFPVHVGLILAGIGGFAVSFTLSVLFLVVRARLKQKRLHDIGRLPSLDALDRRNTLAMAVGFVALTAGMAVGGMWAITHPGRPAGADLTVWATFGLWLWYAAGLHVRLVSGWSGRTAAVFGVGGFAGLGLFVALAATFLRGWHGGAGA
jgi:ABC-type transport system involved in cytochrome c biogenesis permease subunit